MEGYTNLGGSHVDFNDLDIEGRNSDDRKQDKTKRGSETKKEESGQEEQKRLLQIKVKVDDGNYGYVFSVQKRDSMWRWRCHLCDVVIVGQTHVETHIQSKKHQVKMGVLVHERDLFTRFEGEPVELTVAVEDLEVEPGEPAPPGLESTVLKKKGIAQIQAILDCHRSSPLIGLEYLVELTPDERDKEPMYVCTLCDKKGDPRVVMAHLTSFNHRSKYIGINFPMANRAINSSLPRTKEGRRGIADIVTRICSLIEEKHGRLMPLVLQQETYLAKKDFYHLQIENDKHFRETPFENYMDIVEQDAILPNSVNVDDVPLPEKEPSKPEELRRKITVDRSRLRNHASRNESKNSSQDEFHDKRSSDDTGKSKKGVRRSSLSSVSSSSLSRSPSPPRSRSKSRTKSSSPTAVQRRPRTRSHDRFHAQGSRRGRRSRSPRGLPKRSRSRSPRGPPKRSSRSRSTSRGRYRNYARHDKPFIYPNTALAEKDKWTRFRTESDKIERNLNKTLKFHEKNPEKHPMYPEEWKKFWNIRYKELQADGKDPSKHDFKPEWIQFWNKRMKEMYDEEFNLKKEQLREKLDLPKEKTPPPPVPRAPRPPDLDADVIIISPTLMSSADLAPRRGWKGGPASRRVDSERKRSLSPWDKDDVPMHKASRPKWQPPRYDESSRRKDLYEEHSRRKDSYEENSRRKDSYEENPRRKDPYSEESSRRKDSYGEESSRRKEAYLSESSRRKDAYNSPVQLRSAGDDELEPQGEQKEKRVITVIRLLTALESQLGSIGPAVNNLLASALAMEKTRPGASESLLGNPDNLVLFETIKEKLKGQLFAGIVEPGLVMATRSCIQNLAEMLFRAEKMPRMARSLPPPVAPVTVPKPAPVVTVPGVGAMDKAAIATQIAAALVAEGRGDVTQTELESLINAVIGMAQASVTLDKPITAAAFVSQMQPVVALEQKSPLEKLLSVVQSKPGGVEASVKCLFPSAMERVVELPRREPTPPQQMSLVDMEELTEFDLKALLQNFKDLPTNEQYLLITYLKKIEAKEPDRVENLRQFVNLAPFHKSSTATSTERDKVEKDKGVAGRLSPFSLRMGQSNPSVDETFKKSQFENQELETGEKLKLDDSDDDYSFDDICAAAAKKVNEKEQEAKELIRKATDDAINQLTSDTTKEDEANNILRETKLMIANLMGQLPGKFVQKRLTPSPGPAKPVTPTTVDLTIPSRSNVGLNIDISNTLTDAAALDMFCEPKPVPKPTVLGNANPMFPGNTSLTAGNVGSTSVLDTTLYAGVDASYVNNVFNTSYPIQNTNYNGSYGQQPFPNNQVPLVAYPNQQYSNQSYQAGNFMASNVNNGFYSEPTQQRAQYSHQPGNGGNFSQPQQSLAQPVPTQFRPQGYANQQAYNQFPNQQQGFY